MALLDTAAKCAGCLSGTGCDHRRNDEKTVNRDRLGVATGGSREAHLSLYEPSAAYTGGPGGNAADEGLGGGI